MDAAVGELRNLVPDADVLLVLTEWQEFIEADPEVVGRAVRARTIIDARNCLDADSWRAAGWTVRGLGRSTVAGESRPLVLV